MKNLAYFFVFFSFIFVSEMNAQSAKPKKVQTIEFEVNGVCGMCKERIEGAMDYKGIKFAEWNSKTQTLKVVFNTKKITEQQLHERIAHVGHDTSKAKAKDEVYDQLPECCRYRNGEVEVH